MKLILPTDFADAIQPRLPDDVRIVWVDASGNLDEDASDAEVYFNGFRLKPTTLHRVLAAAPAQALAAQPKRWCQSYPHPNIHGTRYHSY